MNEETPLSPEQEQIEKKLSEAFHLMCDGFPEPMQLCHKTHRIVAVNPAAEKYGRVPGANCARNCPSLKAGLCRRLLMTQKNRTTWFHLPAEGERRASTAYWIQIDGYPDYYLHFGIGITINYEANPTED